MAKLPTKRERPDFSVQLLHTLKSNLFFTRPHLCTPCYIGATMNNRDDLIYGFTSILMIEGATKKRMHQLQDLGKIGIGTVVYRFTRRRETPLVKMSLGIILGRQGDMDDCPGLDFLSFMRAFLAPN